ncbi:hypothetical protein LTR66_005665, partial [Elasticomyces elasticus]
MSKRGAEIQGGKDGPREGDGREAPDDVPRRATAAQLARRTSIMAGFLGLGYSKFSKADHRLLNRIRQARGQRSRGASPTTPSTPSAFGQSSANPFGQPQQDAQLFSFGQQQQTQLQTNGGYAFSPSHTTQSFPPPNGAQPQQPPSASFPSFGGGGGAGGVGTGASPFNFGSTIPSSSFSFSAGGNNPFANTSNAGQTASTSGNLANGFSGSVFNMQHNSQAVAQSAAPTFSFGQSAAQPTSDSNALQRITSGPMDMEMQTSPENTPEKTNRVGAPGGFSLFQKPVTTEVGATKTNVTPALFGAGPTALAETAQTANSNPFASLTRISSPSTSQTESQTTSQALKDNPFSFSKSYATEKLPENTQQEQLPKGDLFSRLAHKSLGNSASDVQEPLQEKEPNKTNGFMFNLSKNNGTFAPSTSVPAQNKISQPSQASTGNTSATLFAPPSSLSTTTQSPQNSAFTGFGKPTENTTSSPSGQTQTTNLFALKPAAPEVASTSSTFAPGTENSISSNKPAHATSGHLSFEPSTTPSPSLLQPQVSPPSAQAGALNTQAQSDKPNSMPTLSASSKTTTGDVSTRGRSLEDQRDLRKLNEGIRHHLLKQNADADWSIIMQFYLDQVQKINANSGMLVATVASTSAFTARNESSATTSLFGAPAASGNQPVFGGPTGSGSTAANNTKNANGSLPSNKRKAGEAASESDFDANVQGKRSRLEADTSALPDQLKPGSRSLGIFKSIVDSPRKETEPSQEMAANDLFSSKPSFSPATTSSQPSLSQSSFSFGPGSGAAKSTMSGSSASTAGQPTYQTDMSSNRMTSLSPAKPVFGQSVEPPRPSSPPKKPSVFGSMMRQTPADHAPMMNAPASSSLLSAKPSSSSGSTFTSKPATSATTEPNNHFSFGGQSTKSSSNTSPFGLKPLASSASVDDKPVGVPVADLFGFNKAKAAQAESAPATDSSLQKPVEDASNGAAAAPFKFSVTNPFASVTSSSGATPIQTPKFGIPAATNLLSAFAAKATKQEEKDKERRKAEEFDSDEDDLAEWERQDAEKERARKAQLEQETKGKKAKFVPGKGFVFDDETATSPSAPASSQPNNGAKEPSSGGLFVSRNASPAPTISGAPSIFSNLSSTSQMPSTHNIFGHLSRSETPAKEEELAETDDEGDGQDDEGDELEDYDDEQEDEGNEQEDEGNEQDDENDVRDNAPRSDVAGSTVGMAQHGTDEEESESEDLQAALRKSSTGLPAAASSRSLFDRLDRGTNASAEQGKPEEVKAPTTPFGKSATYENPFSFLQNQRPTGDNTFKHTGPIKFGSTTPAGQPPVKFGFGSSLPTGPSNAERNVQPTQENQPFAGFLSASKRAEQDPTSTKYKPFGAPSQPP